MTSRCLHKSSPTLPQGQRPDPIPAWGNAPGNVSQIKMRAESPSQPAFTRGFESGFQPSGIHRGLFLGRWPRLVCRRAVGAPAASSAMTSRRLHKSSPTLPQGQRPDPYQPGATPQVRGMMKTGGLKARDVKAWAEASPTSAGPGHTFQEFPTRPERPATCDAKLRRQISPLQGWWIFCAREPGASPQAFTSQAFSPGCGWAMAGSRLRWPPARPAAAGRRHNLPSPGWPVEMTP